MRAVALSRLWRVVTQIWRSYRNFLDSLPVALVGLIGFGGCAVLIWATGGDVQSAVLIGLGAGLGSALGAARRRERRTTREK